jgi:hypothetical protein
MGGRAIERSFDRCSFFLLDHSQSGERAARVTGTENLGLYAPLASFFVVIQ